MPYQRKQFQVLKERFLESRKFIQVVVGPLQVGKTTVVMQALQDSNIPYLHFAADNVPTRQTE